MQVCALLSSKLKLRHDGSDSHHGVSRMEVDGASFNDRPEVFSNGFLEPLPISAGLDN